MLYRNQRLVYCGGLRPIHGRNLNPFSESRKPLSPPAVTARAPKQKAPPFLGRAGLHCKNQLSRCYFGGAEDESDEEPVLLLFL